MNAKQDAADFTWGGGVARHGAAGPVTIPIRRDGQPSGRLVLTLDEAEYIVDMLSEALADSVGAGTRRR